jgi:hypothetical protein
MEGKMSLTVVSDRYGEGEFESYEQVAEQIEELGYTPLVKTHTMCDCGEWTTIYLSLTTGEAVLVESRHVGHQAW